MRIEVFLLNDINQPKTSRGQETLERILKASEMLFGERGYYNTTISEITREADIALGTFYLYFKDKLSVFRFLVEELSESLRKEISEAIKDCKTRYDAEYLGFKAFFNFVSQHKGLYKIIWEAQFVDEEIFRNYYENFAKRYIKRIKDAQNKGEMELIDPESLAYCFIGITNFAALRWVIWEDDQVPEEVIEEIMKFVKKGAFIEK